MSISSVESMTDIYEVIQEGIVDRLFEMVQGCLLNSWNAAGRPARNKVATNKFNPTAMKKLCNTVAPYGSPIIYCTPEFAAEMVNALVYNANNIKLSDVDMQEVRDRGYIGKFYGTPVVVMPQSQSFVVIVILDRCNSTTAVPQCQRKYHHHNIGED